MKTIQLNSNLYKTTNLNTEFDNINHFVIDDKPFASGGFGEVYLCKSANGKTLKRIQVIKILLNDGTGSDERGFNTIRRFQDEISKYNEKLKDNNEKTLDKVNGLGALPQFSFEGTLNNKRVTGYSANLLESKKWIEFDSFFNEADLDKRKKLKNEFYNLSVNHRLKMAYDLVEAFKHLGNMNFIYADLNPKNFFVNMTEGKLCLIDYEGGAINDNPEIFGKPGDWLAPEIQKQLRSGKSLITVDFNTDTWAVAIGVHFLLFPFHPLFFLKTVGRDEISNYFLKYRYPVIDKTETNFKDPQAYDWYIERLKQLPNGIIKAFDETVNYGYKNPSRRLSYKQWHQAIGSLMTKPIIKRFTSNSSTVLNGKSVELLWDVEDFESINIAGIGYITGKNSISVSPTQSVIYKLTAENAFGKVEQEIRIEVLALPKIKEFRSKQHKIEFSKSTDLKWDIENAEKVELFYDGKSEVLNNRGEKKIEPQKHTHYKIVATSLDGKTKIEQEVTVEVYSRIKIKSFTSNYLFVVASVPVTLNWDIENATEIVLEDNLGNKTDVFNNTEFSEHIKQDTTYRIWCKNELFNETSVKLHITVIQNKYELELLNLVPKFDQIVPDIGKAINLDYEFIPTIDYDIALSLETIDFNLTIDHSDGTISTNIAKKVSKPKNIKSIVDKIKSYIKP
ncbi:serine/threonine protein kinase [Pedobacter cryotolerans]|uniref:Protein kinase family protein n=1 Tax=Pedobacter cryotolerans TaxID=2571270 RepID=A0A4V6WN14_9SPHI|nr:serine/threonine-protein kinase [Pedobacter cryotolerans]TKC03194.1 protein kinase family protein [Pedobacter cryotolerans]